jgi:hypothetical protein
MGRWRERRTQVVSIRNISIISYMVVKSITWYSKRIAHNFDGNGGGHGHVCDDTTLRRRTNQAP